MDHRLHNFKEGSPYSKLRWLMSYHGRNVDLELKLATVVAPLPSIKIKMDYADKLVLEEDDIVVLEHLRDRTEEMIIDGITKTVTVKSSLKENDRVLVAVPEGIASTYWIIGKV
jgi:Protein of unknown function (DUF2577)